MVKKGKLKLALDAHQGVDYRIEHQKRKHKQAEQAKKLKRKRDALDEEEDSDAESEQSHFSDAREALEDSDLIDFPDVVLSDDIKASGEVEVAPNGLGEEQGSGDESAEDEEEEAIDEDDDELDEDEDIPLSDLEEYSESETGDIIPHQRLTINNHSALLKALNSIALPRSSTVPFSEHQTVISDQQIEVPEIDDDLKREAVFQEQALAAAIEGRRRLRKEGIPFSRPPDYFAEMVKSDEHMGKIKGKVADDKASKLAAAEARKQRDLRKFGKQVQVEKKQERDKAKRDTLDKIKILKRQRKSGDVGNAKEEDMFDVALEDASRAEKKGRNDRKGPNANSRSKRDNKDKKYGFGGKKRFSKSGDATSSGDLSGYSAKKMKSSPRGTKRLGKSKRMKTKL